MKEKLRQQYDELVSGIETVKMFDGRNKGVDVHVCKKCGKRFYTKYKDKGVTPFTIKCRHCEHGTMTHDQTISEMVANFMGFKINNWVRPTFEQFLKLSEGAQKYVLNGGLMLEDELGSKEENIVKEKFDEIQGMLEQLQGKDASFLFIGHEGNHFTLGGNSINIATQIIFAMCRYPVVKQIIKLCAEKYDEADAKWGDDFRNMKIDHLIEHNAYGQP